MISPSKRFNVSPNPSMARGMKKTRAWAKAGRCFQSHMSKGYAFRFPSRFVVAICLKMDCLGSPYPEAAIWVEVLHGLRITHQLALPRPQTDLDEKF
jgi:hypothetical protein